MHFSVSRFLAHQIRISEILPWDRISFLAHPTRISEILSWDRKSYLTMLSYPGCHVRATYIGCINWNCRHVTSLLCSSDFIMWNCILAYSGTSGGLVLNKKQWWARKRIHYWCEGRIEKSVSWYHRFSSLSKPPNVKRRSSGQIFLSYPHTHDRFL